MDEEAGCIPAILDGEGKHVLNLTRSTHTLGHGPPCRRPSARALHFIFRKHLTCVTQGPGGRESDLPPSGKEIKRPGYKCSCSGAISIDKCNPNRGHGVHERVAVAFSDLPNTKNYWCR